eukprot:TRINITY_DN21787_c0_g1_i2.p1 TRINITY_DN21787_c0_g1~~TRINITY_DN21787_c0_g1_i2.p1  ORF type:complete len:154 (+),score=6.50 TRINITY_DN21787_c0_g1_i2:152-613(+)
MFCVTSNSDHPHTQGYNKHYQHQKQLELVPYPFSSQLPPSSTRSDSFHSISLASPPHSSSLLDRRDLPLCVECHLPALYLCSTRWQECCHICDHTETEKMNPASGDAVCGAWHCQNQVRKRLRLGRFRILTDCGACGCYVERTVVVHVRKLRN